jgi:hypothetical protein
MVCCVVKINEPSGFCKEAPPVKPNNDENTLSSWLKYRRRTLFNWSKYLLSYWVVASGKLGALGVSGLRLILSARLV